MSSRRPDDPHWPMTFGGRAITELATIPPPAVGQGGCRQAAGVEETRGHLAEGKPARDPDWCQAIGG
jgi:hypothetical protein